MYINCIKSYFNSLKHIMTIFGLLAFGLILGFGNFGKSAYRSANTMTQDIKEDYEEADLSLTVIKDSIISRASKLDLGDVVDVISEKSLRPIIEGEISESIEKVIKNYKDFADEVIEEEEECVEEIYLAAIVFILTLVLCMVIGFFAAEISVRKGIGSVGFWRMLLEMLVRFAMYAAACAIAFGIMKLFSKMEVGLCVLPFLLVFAGLFSAWLTAGPDRVSFGKAVNIGNYLVLLLANLTVLAATALIAYLLYLILANIVATALIAVSLLVVLLVSMDMSASAMVISAKKNETPAA